MAGVLVARPGALARPSPLAELSCAPPTLRCCVEGRRAAGPARLWQGQVTWEARPVRGGRALAPAPSHLRHRVPPGRGLAAAPHGGATTAETPVCLRPQNLPSHLLCAHVCECVKLRATVCTGASRVPEQGAVPRGHLSQGGGFGSTRGEAWACEGTRLHFQRKSEAAHPGSCGWPRPAARASAVTAPRGRRPHSPLRLCGGPGRPRESGPASPGEKRRPQGASQPLLL